MSAVCPDVSEYQVPLNGTYDRDFVIFRATFGDGKVDNHFLANANAADRLHRQGRLAGAILYTVYTDAPVQSQFDLFWRAVGPVPAWLMGVMIDVESWRGTNYSLSGNHSPQINALYGMHAHKMGSWNAAFAYGNESDLAELYPWRDPRCAAHVASYSSWFTYQRVRGGIGQQYTDGSGRWSWPHGLPDATPPFGPCDHNVFPGFANGHALRAHLRPAPPAVKPQPKPGPPAPKPVPKPTPKPVEDLSILDAPTKKYLDDQFATVDAGIRVVVHGDATHPHGLDELFTTLDNRLSAIDGAIAQLRSDVAALRGPAV